MKGGDKTQATTNAPDLSLKTYGYPEGANSDASAAQATTLARTQKQQTMNNTFSTGGTRKKTKKSHRSTKKKYNLSNYFILTYKFKNGISSKRKLIREKHLLFCKQFEENNSLLMGGPLSSSDDLFIFNNKKLAEKFKHKDPYILNKLVSKASIKPWNVTVGVLKLSYHLSNLFNQLGGGISNTTTAVQFNTSSISPNANANSTALSNQSTALQNSANAKYDACVGQPPSCGN